VKVKVVSRVSQYALPLGLFYATLLLYTPAKSFLAGLEQNWLFVMGLSFFLSFFLTPVFRLLAIRWNVLDIPDGRKIHKNATPLLGGLSVFTAFLVGAFLNGFHSMEFFSIICGAGMIFAVSLWDDFKGMSASGKLIVQILATALVMSSGIVLRVVPDTLGVFAEISNVLLTFMWIIGITNGMNFFDGMDGLAAGLGAIFSLFLGIVAFQTGQTALGWLSVIMMGSCLGFLPFNFRIGGNASIFLGDAGSTFIGYTLACLAVFGDWSETSTVVSLASPLLIFWILIFDMVHITVDRIATGKVMTFKGWIDYVGKDHLHHRLFNVLGSKTKTVFLIYLVTLILGSSALLLRNASAVDAILLLFQATLIVILVTILERHSNGHSKKDTHRRGTEDASKTMSFPPSQMS
jgi:UDP-GlcNAc:undecaprenyl-phosphate GlcNAc-1-phosphate transferase